VTTANPFRDPLIAVDNGGPLDAVEAWERVRFLCAAYDDGSVAEAGDRLAKHATSLRTWTVALERENAELRALVERARDLQCTPETYDRLHGWLDWFADAERVLAAGGEDESE
jgi:hypothetical protein